MAQTLQLKDTDWVNGLQKTTHIFAAYRKHTSPTKTQTESKMMEG